MLKYFFVYQNLISNLFKKHSSINKALFKKQPTNSLTNNLKIYKLFLQIVMRNKKTFFILITFFGI